MQTNGARVDCATRGRIEQLSVKNKEVALTVYTTLGTIFLGYEVMRHLLVIYLLMIIFR